MRRRERNNWRRPRSLRAVVREAGCSEEIGLNLADFLDHLNLQASKRTARNSVAASLCLEPPRTGVPVQDAYLAAVAAQVAHRFRLRAPRWTEKRCRRLEHPWFALPDAWARAMLLRDSPAEFRERNLFTTPDALHRV